MIDPRPRLRAHEGGGRGVPAAAGAVHDPFDELGRDVLVGPEVQQLAAAEPVHDPGARLFVGRDEVEERVDEPLHTPVEAGVGIEEDRGLRPALGDVLVL